MGKQRAIRRAIDQLTGEILIADDLFRGSKKAAEARKLYNENRLIPLCPECDQKLQISKSRHESHYFKHFQDSDPCFLKDNHFSQKDNDLIEAILFAKEGERHKSLKNKISQLLIETEGVVIDSVYTDNRFIFYGKEKRRPDVYCLYKDKALVFEIQLSDLSLRYILDRHNFYKNKGIYLVWILDKFDVQGQTTMEKDIKYLSTFQNFFRLDEGVDSLKLLCTYKQPMINNNRVITPWKTRSVSLSDINFCGETLQVYYHDFERNRKRIEKEVAEIVREPVREEVAVQDYGEFEEEWYEHKSQEKVDELINQIALCRKKGLLMTKVEGMLGEFDEYDFETLNEKLEFNIRKPNGKPLLCYYIENSTKDQFPFLYFLLRERRIEIDVNAGDEYGRSAFQEIYLNRDVGSKEMLILQLFKRGYQLTAKDTAFFQSEKVNVEDKAGQFCIFSLYQRVNDAGMIDAIYQNKSLFFVIESARQQKMVGFRYNNWISFGINAIHLYKKFWRFIEPALKQFGVWGHIVNEDRKGTFNNKLIAYRDELPEQDISIMPVMQILYPTLFS